MVPEPSQGSVVAFSLHRWIVSLANTRVNQSLARWMQNRVTAYRIFTGARQSSPGTGGVHDIVISLLRADDVRLWLMRPSRGARRG